MNHVIWILSIDHWPYCLVRVNSQKVPTVVTLLNTLIVHTTTQRRQRPFVNRTFLCLFVYLSDLTAAEIFNCSSFDLCNIEPGDMEGMLMLRKIKKNEKE